MGILNPSQYSEGKAMACAAGRIKVAQRKGVSCRRQESREILGHLN